MSLYYEDDFVKLYHGDCLTEHREWLEADVLVTDPPYGRGWKQGELKKTRSFARAGIANDRSTEVRDEALSAWGERVAIAFGDLMLAPPKGSKLTGVYWKANGAEGMRGAIAKVRRDAEAIYFIGPWESGIGGRSSVFMTRECISAVHGIAAKAGGHPHTKPQSVMTELINLCPSGTIADPFAGGGSTLVAAKALGRKAIGVELSEKWAEKAARRLSQEVLDFGALA